MSSLPTDAALPPPPHWERCAVWLLLGAFVLLGANNILNHAFAGQDFSMHVGCTNRLLAHPGEWFTHDFTNRPLIYWIALDAMALTGDRATYELTSAIFVLLNTGALFLFYDCSRRCLAVPALRVAALALVSTLPVTVITGVVFAADAMVQPLFALLGWSLIRWTEVNSPRAALAYAALAGATLLLGQFAKFTFIGLPIVVLGLAVLLWRWQRVSARHVIWLVTLGVAIPLLGGLWLHRRATRELASQAAWHTFDPHGTGEMTWHSLLGLRASDARIFAAPTYWDRAVEDGRTTFPLLAPNGFSYPALLHLATFTDVLDFGHGGALYGRVPRPPLQQHFARWSVRTGLLFSLTALAAGALFWWRLARTLFRPALAPATALLVWSVLALAWQLALTLPLPFTHHAYDWGYWLPRLVVPALWGFALVLFAQLDAWLAHRRSLAVLVAVITFLQASLHVCSLWF